LIDEMLGNVLPKLLCGDGGQLECGDKGSSFTIVMSSMSASLLEHDEFEPL
jgi:hypothetical protein